MIVKLLNHSKMYVAAITLCIFLLPQKADAQRFAVKSNAAYWAALSPNAGVEFVLSDKISLDVSGSFCPINNRNFKFAYLSLQPELRYWFDRPMINHYVGVNFNVSPLNFLYKTRHYKGILFAAGVGYGYAVPISKQWNFEPSIGLGIGVQKDFGISSKTRVFPTITKLGLSFSYIIK